MELRVTSVGWETEAVRTIELRPLQAQALPSFEAGSHVELHLPAGLVRSYSLMNSQNERHRYLLGVARELHSRGGSSYLHDQLRVGDVLSVDAPRNLFALDESASSSVLIAGGIGITPMVSMACRLNQLARDWTLHYAVRTRSQAAFLSALGAYGDRVILHCDDEQGRVLDMVRILSAAPPAAHFYCCGPKPMMQAFGELTCTMQPERIHVEHFSPLAEAATGGGYLIELARSGRTLAIPKGGSVLETLLKAGFNLPNSCQQGVCGTCETRVISGIPDHRDSVLSAAERASNKTMMICCSGSLSEKLVLDI
jgi:vanillate O-demethylase ferredoxin subunit